MLAKYRRCPSFVLLLAASLAGLPALSKADVWTSYQHDSALTGYSSATLNAAQLTHAWSTPAGYNNPLIDNGYLYADSTTALTAFNLSDGSIAWSTPIAGGGPMAISGNQLVATSFPFTSSKSLAVFNAVTGASEYSVPFGANTMSPGTPVLYTLNGQLNALDVDQTTNMYSIKLGATSGSINWNTAVGNAFNMPPTIVGNSAIVAGGQAAVAVDLATGNTNVFKLASGSTGTSYATVYDASRSQFYFESFSSNTMLQAYSYTSYNHLTPLWSTPAGNSSDPALDSAGNIYIASGSTINELSPIDGSVIRTANTLPFDDGTPQLTGQYLFDQSGQHEVAYSLSNLSLVNSFGTVSPGGNTTYRDTDAIADGYFAFQSMAGTNATPDVIEVYSSPIPEPPAALMLLVPLALLLLRLPKRAITLAVATK